MFTFFTGSACPRKCKFVTTASPVKCVVTLICFGGSSPSILFAACLERTLTLSSFCKKPFHFHLNCNDRIYFHSTSIQLQRPKNSSHSHSCVPKCFQLHWKVFVKHFVIDVLCVSCYFSCFPQITVFAEQFRFSFALSCSQGVRVFSFSFISLKNFAVLLSFHNLLFLTWPEQVLYTLIFIFRNQFHKRSDEKSISILCEHL